jgi:hypothetical protein
VMFAGEIVAEFDRSEATAERIGAAMAGAAAAAGEEWTA